MLLALLALLCTSTGVLACGCGMPGPVLCPGGFGSDEVLFVGTVVHADNPAPEYGGQPNSSGLSRYTFQIDERFASAQEQMLDVYSGRGGGDCSYHFQQGQQYLVSALKATDGSLFASLCTITRPIAHAQALLPQLRAMRDHKQVASLYGILKSTDMPYLSISSDWWGTPQPKVRIKLRSGETVLETTTDTNGAYAFYDLPGGSYRINAELPNNLAVVQPFSGEQLLPIELPNAACYEYDVSAYPTGSIRGRVLGPDGKPLAYAQVGLFRPEEYHPNQLHRAWMESQESWTTGYFEFAHVGPGDYILVYNDEGRTTPDRPYGRFFYPGVTNVAHAGRIHVDAAEHVSDADIRLGEGRPTRTLKVRLVAEVGKLPDIHHIESRSNEGLLLTGQREFSPGFYEILLFKGVQYTIRGEGYCSATGEKSQTNSIVVYGTGNPTSKITLVFRGARCGE
jgi:hypothetical protein